MVEDAFAFFSHNIKKAQFQGTALWECSVVDGTQHEVRQSGPALMDLTGEGPSPSSKPLLEPEPLLVKTWPDARIQLSREKIWHCLTPAAFASVVRDLKPPLWPDRSPALLIPTPGVFPFQPLQRLLLRLHSVSPSINLTGYSLPNPSWDWEKRRGLGWETEKAFMFLAFLAGKSLRKLLFYCFQALSSHYTNRSLEGSVSPSISLYRVKTSEKHGNHSTSWKC